MITFIDGPSGAGKTTRALELGAQRGIPVVHLDDFYPGWHGLEEGAAMVPGLILRGRYRSWDWEADAPGEERQVDLRAGAIIEGCGAVTAGALVAATMRGHEFFCEWWDGEAVFRRAAALARDPEYTPFWGLWAGQEKRFFARVAPLWGYLEGVELAGRFRRVSQG